MTFICKRLLITYFNFTAARTQQRRLSNMATKSAAKFEPTISLANPLDDYKKLIQEKMESDEIIDDDVRQESYARISAKMRDTIWQLLFAEEPAKPENLAKASECLYEHKMDACFHSPRGYNEWIPKVRDELLRRKMYDFWREHMVKRELGLCWARDSDYYDDMDDKRPEEFYKHAGCVAVFSAEAKQQQAAGGAKTDADVPPLSPAATSSSVSTATAEAPNEISMDTPCEDYKAKMEYQLNLDADDEDAFKRIFVEVREIIWKLLFAVKPLATANYEKAANTLEAYKRDACFYSPWDYNDWIPKVRDELFARKYFQFWKDVILAKKLGLCWYKDSDFFDDTIDRSPLEFYKSGDKLMK